MEWENHQEGGGEVQHQHQHEQQQEQQNMNNNGNSDGSNISLAYVKVMTDEQMEILRKQISVYSTICEQLVEMHKSLTAQHDLAGVRLGNIYCDPFMTSNCHKISARQRWTPSPVQLQILERIFDQGTGTPSKQKIKEITSELSQHGPISETNVYNWFQNRRARSKRKQSVATPNNAESEVDTEVESPREKKTKPETENFQSAEQQMIPDLRADDDMCFQNTELHSLEPHSNEAAEETMFQADDGLRTSRSLGLSFYESVLSNPSMYTL